MRSSRIEINRGVLLGIACAYIMICGMTIGMLRIPGVILVIGSLVGGTIIGCITYIEGRIRDKKKIDIKLD